MAEQWPEVKKAFEEKRKELVLRDEAISQRIDKQGLDNTIFRIKALNYLEISRTSLKNIPDDVGDLINLTSLVLHTNKLTALPNTIGKLAKLKFLDFYRNEIETFPEELTNFPDLHTLNISSNKLEHFPSVKNLLQLHVFNVSLNQLTELPPGVAGNTLIYLADLNASGNQISEVPGQLNELPVLKNLDLSDNLLKEIPPELSECPKLKEANFKGNKLDDHRLRKLIDQCHAKSVLDYLDKTLQKERAKGKGKGKDAKDRKERKRKKGKGAVEDVEEMAKHFMRVLHFPGDEKAEKGVVVKLSPGVNDVRPHIICAIIRHLDFGKSVNMFKRFITLQTKLHEGICEKRQSATIATHDLKAVKSPLVYMARKPEKIKIAPLFKQKESSAADLMTNLRKEADDLRKEKKRNAVSGLYKYLDLLNRKTHYPCLVDSDGKVISFPPITNSDVTKISKDTTDIFVEVTSTISLDTCKKVMEELLHQVLEMGVGGGDGAAAVGEEAAAQGAEADPSSSGQPHTLVVEQVRILDMEGSLKAVYPARTDLQNDAFDVTRDYQ